MDILHYRYTDLSWWDYCDFDRWQSFFGNNRQCVRLKRARRFARKRGLIADITARQWNQAILFFDGRCAYCNVELIPTGRENCSLSLDHFIPLSFGGASTRENLVPCCHTCNAAKLSQLPLCWLVGFFGEWEGKIIYWQVLDYLGSVD